MCRAKRLTGVALGTALLISLALGPGAVAQETATRSLELTPSRGSGVSGTATLKDVEGGVQVALEMRGLPEAGVEHINHFHGGGTCAEDRAGRTAPVTIPLDPVVAEEGGTGFATTVLRDVTLTQLFDASEDRFLLLHAEAEGEGVPPGIACADLALPSTGGGVSPPVLLCAGAVLVLAAAAASFALRRRNA